MMKELFEKWYLYALAFVIWLVIGTKDPNSLGASIISFISSLLIAIVLLVGLRGILKVVHVVLNIVGYIPIKIFMKFSKR